MGTRIFIGSSTESKPIAKKVQEQLSPDYECILWCDDFFELNQQTYRVLAKKAITFDFSIYIGGKDDFVTRIEGGSDKVAPRDNLYLEFGLYAGILSPARTFFVLSEECKVASDLEGITLLYFSDEASLVKCCDRIRTTLNNEQGKSRIQLLPSTSLAVGYYYNFLKILSQVMDATCSIKIGNRSVTKFKQVELEILIPTDVEVDWESWALNYYRKQNVVRATIVGKIRPVGVLLDKRKLEEDNILRILDIPQTLRASFTAVDLVFGKDSIGPDEAAQIAKQREVDNFCATLRHLIKKDAFLSDITRLSVVN